MSKGKVVLVPFPFDDLSASKVRPAVCLTDPLPRVLTTTAAVIQRELGILPERARAEIARRLRKLFDL